jgi:hypothetical protein
MTIINREEIPQGVLDDIYNHYEEITFDNYGKPVTDQVVTRASNYYRVIAENVECTVLDRDTFEPTLMVGTERDSYLVRGIFTDNACDVYAVMSSGISFCSNKDLGVEE